MPITRHRSVDTLPPPPRSGAAPSDNLRHAMALSRFCAWLSGRTLTPGLRKYHSWDALCDARETAAKAATRRR